MTTALTSYEPESMLLPGWSVGLAIWSDRAETSRGLNQRQKTTIRTPQDVRANLHQAALIFVCSILPVLVQV